MAGFLSLCLIQPPLKLFNTLNVKKQIFHKLAVTLLKQVKLMLVEKINKLIVTINSTIQLCSNKTIICRITTLLPHLQ